MSTPNAKQVSPYRVLSDPIADDDAVVGAASWEEEVHLRDYWRVLVKHRGIVVGILLACVLSTAVVVLMTAPLYTATSTIQIERQAPKFAPVQGVEQVETLSFDKYDYYQTQFEVLGSHSVASRVIKALSLDSDRRFIGARSPNIFSMAIGWAKNLFARERRESRAVDGVDPRLIERYLAMLSIDPVRNSRLVKVGFTSPDSDLSAQVADRHVEEFVNSSLDQRLKMTLKAKGFLEVELAKARDRVVAAEVALNKFRKDKGIISLDGEKSDIVSERLDDLNKRFTEAQADRIRLEGQYELIKSRDFEALPDVASSQLIVQLKQEVAKIEVERAELAKKYKPGYPKMGETIAREAEAKQRLGGEIRKIVGSIESGYLAARTRETEIGKQLEAQRQAALTQKDMGADYDTLKRDVDTARLLYANLLQRLKDVDVAEQIKVSNVSVVDSAVVPMAPSRPKKRLDLVLATVIGLLGGVGMAFFLEYLDNTVKTPEDVSRRLGLPTLGVVPFFDTPGLAYGNYSYGRRRGRPAHEPGAVASVSGGATNGESTDLVVGNHPMSVVSEAYRTIRTAILLSSADNPPRVVIFTSASVGEGKTVTAINEAVTLARAGGRVLMIDADLRKPRLHRIFGVSNGHGLSTYLTGQSPLDLVIHEVGLNGRGGEAPSDGGDRSAVDGGRLFVIPAGPLPPNPAELLGSKRMRETLGTMRADFDYVVIDTPPVLPVTDAVLLATMSDGVVLVVRGQKTPFDVAQKSHERLAYARVKILGVVLNDVDVTSGDYDQYHRYYYAYHADRDETAPE